MSKRLFKTMVAVLAIAAAAAGPAWGQISKVSWVLTPYGDLQNGDTVVIVDKTLAKALPNNNGTSSAPSAVAIGLNSAKDSLTGTPAATLQWVVVLDNGDYTFQVPGTSNYLYCTNNNNGVRVGDDVDDDKKFTFVDNQGYYDVPFLKNIPQARYIGVYNDQDWRCYANTSNNIKNTVIGFYKKTVTIIPTHTVRMAEGTEEAANWTLASGDASVQGNQVLGNVMSGSQVTATYSGTQKVKSVKAVKYVPPAATVTTAPTATAAIIEANTTAALVNAGAANGGTMMYAVTATNAQPASTADFSASIPTAQGRAAGTYYVWYYAKADAQHSDSEIAGPVSVTLAVMTTVTWNSSNVFNSAHMVDQIGAWESGSLTFEDITISKSGDYLSTFYAFNIADETGSLKCFGDESDPFTFTAPQGKLFCKIEIIDNEGITFDEYGDWTYPVGTKIVWSGTAASTVTLGTVFTAALNLNSIVFKLIDAQ